MITLRKISFVGLLFTGIAVGFFGGITYYPNPHYLIKYLDGGKDVSVIGPITQEECISYLNNNNEIENNLKDLISKEKRSVLHSWCVPDNVQMGIKHNIKHK